MSSEMTYEALEIMAKSYFMFLAYDYFVNRNRIGQMHSTEALLDEAEIILMEEQF